MTKQQPDKRIRPDLPKDPFGDFQYRQALAEEMLPMMVAFIEIMSTFYFMVNH